MCQDPKLSKCSKTQRKTKGNIIEYHSLKILDNFVQAFSETSHQLEIMICLNLTNV